MSDTIAAAAVRELRSALIAYAPAFRVPVGMLQTAPEQILARLLRAPKHILTIDFLARFFDPHGQVGRESTCFAIHVVCAELVLDGFVTRDGDTVTLTEAGAEEVRSMASAREKRKQERAAELVATQTYQRRAQAEADRVEKTGNWSTEQLAVAYALGLRPDVMSERYIVGAEVGDRSGEMFRTRCLECGESVLHRRGHASAVSKFKHGASCAYVPAG
jgi:hypothetical protein